MTHNPAVDSQHIEALRALRSMFGEDRIPPPCHERDAIDAAIAALTRPPGGSERQALQLCHDALMKFSEQVEPPPWKELTAALDAAQTALASPQGAEQRQEALAVDLPWPDDSVDCTEPNRADCPRKCIDFCNKLESTPHPAQAAPQADQQGASLEGDALDLVRDLAVNGLRFSLTPCLDWSSKETIHAFWSGYMRQANASIRDRARAALASGASPPGVQAAQVSDAMSAPRSKWRTGGIDDV